MKKEFFKLISVIIIFSLSGYMTLAIENSNTSKAAIEWEKTEYDFGKIKKNVPVTADFEFKNTSLVPLVITSVRASCGCTVASYPKKPIKPGETEVISTTFDARNSGHFTKSITVHSNANDPVQVLVIKGEVIVK